MASKLFAACLERDYARRADFKRRRAKCRADANLCAILQADANRRGQTEIDWPEYFRNSEISYGQ